MSSPAASVRLERVLTLSVAAQVWTLNNRPITITLANFLANAEIAAPQEGLVDQLKALTTASRQSYFAERSAVNPLRVVAGDANGSFAVIGNPDLFELAKRLSDKDRVNIRADVFAGPLTDRKVRNIRGHELIAAPAGTPAQRAGQCLQHDLLPTALRPARTRKVRQGAREHMRIVSRIFGVTEPAVRAHLVARRDHTHVTEPEVDRAGSEEHAGTPTHAEEIPSAGAPAATENNIRDHRTVAMISNGATVPIPDPGDEVDGTTHDHDVPARLVLARSTSPEIEHVVQIDVGQQRTDIVALHGADPAPCSRPLLQPAGVQAVPVLDAENNTGNQEAIPPISNAGTGAAPAVPPRAGRSKRSAPTDDSQLSLTFDGR